MFFFFVKCWIFWNGALSVSLFFNAPFVFFRLGFYIYRFTSRISLFIYFFFIVVFISSLKEEMILFYRILKISVTYVPFCFEVFFFLFTSLLSMLYYGNNSAQTFVDIKPSRLSLSQIISVLNYFSIIIIYRSLETKY